MMSNTALKSVSSLSAHASSSLLLRRAGRKISSRSRKSTTFYKTTTTKAFASSEGGEGKEEEEWAAMGSNAKSNVVPRRPQLSATNAPEYMHGVDGVQSLLPGKRERRHVQPSSLGCFGEFFFRFRYVFIRSVFLLDEYKDDDAIFGNDGKKYCMVVMILVVI